MTSWAVMVSKAEAIASIRLGRERASTLRRNSLSLLHSLFDRIEAPGSKLAGRAPWRRHALRARANVRAVLFASAECLFYMSAPYH